MGQEIAMVAQRETAGLVASEAHRFSVVEIRQRVNLVQEVMQNIMKRDTHYGTIPGTPKPTLYKPGAEVLCVTFRIAQEYRIEDLSSDGHARYRVTCIGRHQTTGITLGEGVGECSSGEEKYKWRGAACKAELDYTPENMRRKKFYKNGNSVDQIRTEPADLANTILKMACKRAMIAMTLNVTAASDIFTQDIEDIPEELRTEEAGQPATDPELTAKWVKMATGATNAEALTEIWQAGVKEIQAVKDMTAYNAFKAAVGARGEALKKEHAASEPEPEAQQPATEPSDDDDVPFD
ncbi:MAG: hypothetical protein V7756_12875 [Halopseudomonas sp.]|uniref:hypothetical protein n=1 Tax=Halopseudomonas sp. TaxID=2901191 RepID=UPI0030018996